MPDDGCGQVLSPYAGLCAGPCDLPEQQDPGPIASAVNSHSSSAIQTFEHEQLRAEGLPDPAANPPEQFFPTDSSSSDEQHTSPSYTPPDLNDNKTPTSTLSTTSSSPSPQHPDTKCNLCGLSPNRPQLLLEHFLNNHRPIGPGVRWSCGTDGHGTCKTERDFRRHFEDMHLGLKYVCFCGLKHRKDKHVNHIRKKICRRAVGQGYVCICGHATESLQTHELHIASCVLMHIGSGGEKRKRGRPPKRVRVD